MSEFIPESPQALGLEIPYFEDVEKSAQAPGRFVKKPVTYYQDRIKDLLLRLGAGAVTFIPGRYPSAPPRHGYRITFSLNGVPGRLECLALPMRGENKRNKDRALAQALWLLGNWLEAEVNSAIYRPGTIPLVPYLIGASGRTVTEELVERKSLPDLSQHYLPAPKPEGR